jgi:hypothetical protein
MMSKSFYMCGAQLKNFRKGWAIQIGPFGKGHYWIRNDFRDASSICGLIAPIRWLYAVGTWPLCKKCCGIRQYKKVA